MPSARLVGETVITGQMRSVTTRVPAQPLASTARSVMLTPAPLLAVGVPPITPETELSVSPAGSVPPLME